MSILRNTAVSLLVLGLWLGGMAARADDAGSSAKSSGGDSGTTRGDSGTTRGDSGTTRGDSGTAAGGTKAAAKADAAAVKADDGTPKNDGGAAKSDGKSAAAAPRDEDQSRVSTEKLRLDGPVGKMTNAPAKQKGTTPAAASTPPKKFEKLPPIDAGTLRAVDRHPKLQAPPQVADKKAAAKPAVAAKAEQKKAAAPPADELAVTELSKDLLATRDRVRWAIDNYFHQSVATRDHTPGDVLYLCTAYGCRTSVQYENEELNGITCLCWNYPCGGFALLDTNGSSIFARVGYGYQSQPGQLLAVLALARVPADYPVRVGQQKGTVAHLIADEKLRCRDHGDQALRLIGLAHFVPLSEAWTNELGQKCSIEHLAKAELAQPLGESAYGGTQRLLGLSVALNRWHKTQPQRESPLLEQAARYVGDVHAYAFRTQGSDGSWRPHSFPGIARGSDTFSVFRSSAHVAQWLAYSLPGKRLAEPAMVQAIAYVNDVLVNQAQHWNMAGENGEVLEAMTCGLSALSIYDQRLFKPFDKQIEEQKKAEEKKAAAEKPADQARVDEGSVR